MTSSRSSKGSSLSEPENEIPSRKIVKLSPPETRLSLAIRFQQQLWNKSEGGVVFFENPEKTLEHFEKTNSSSTEPIKNVFSFFNVTRSKIYWAEKKNTPALFKITDVFGENDFAMQQYDSTESLKILEETLQEFCELRIQQVNDQPLVLEIQKYYAVLTELGKWTRCVLIDFVREQPSKAIFRKLDYGTWFSLDVNRNIGHYVLNLPYFFGTFQPQGVTAGQSYNPILKYRIPLEVLKELKGAVVQVWISNAIDPVEESGDISHVYVIFVNILKTLKNKNSNFKNIDRRNTI